MSVSWSEINPIILAETNLRTHRQTQSVHLTSTEPQLAWTRSVMPLPWQLMAMSGTMGTTKTMKTRTEWWSLSCFVWRPVPFHMIGTLCRREKIASTLVA